MHVNDSFIRILVTAFVATLATLMLGFRFFPDLPFWGAVPGIWLFLSAQEMFFINRKMKSVIHLEAIDQLEGDGLNIKEIPENLRDSLGKSLKFRPKYIITFIPKRDGRDDVRVKYNLDGQTLDIKEAVRRMYDFDDTTKVEWSRHYTALFFSEDAENEVVSFKLSFDADQVNIQYI
jgi:hypothetical protein